MKLHLLIIALIAPFGSLKSSMTVMATGSAAISGRARTTTRSSTPKWLPRSSRSHSHGSSRSTIAWSRRQRRFRRLRRSSRHSIARCRRHRPKVSGSAIISGRWRNFRPTSPNGRMITWAGATPSRRPRRRGSRAHCASRLRHPSVLRANLRAAVATTGARMFAVPSCKRRRWISRKAIAATSSFFRICKDQPAGRAGRATPLRELPPELTLVLAHPSATRSPLLAGLPNRIISAPTLAEAVKLVTAALTPANPTALAEKAPPSGTP